MGKNCDTSSNKMKILCGISLAVFLFYIVFYVFDVCKLNAAPKSEIFDIARKGTVNQVEEYLATYPSMDLVNSSGYTPLILACYHGNVNVAQLLAKHTKKINYQEEYGTALHAASYKNHLEIVKSLLEYKADPNIVDEQGTTALIYATQNKNPKMVALLLKYGADKAYLDQRGNNALQYALKSKSSEIIELLN